MYRLPDFLQPNIWTLPLDPLRQRGGLPEISCSLGQGWQHYWPAVGWRRCWKLDCWGAERRWGEKKSPNFSANGGVAVSTLLCWDARGLVHSRPTLTGASAQFLSLPFQTTAKNTKSCLSVVFVVNQTVICISCVFRSKQSNFLHYHKNSMVMILYITIKNLPNRMALLQNFFFFLFTSRKQTKKKPSKTVWNKSRAPAPRQRCSKTHVIMPVGVINTVSFSVTSQRLVSQKRLASWSSAMLLSIAQFTSLLSSFYSFIDKISNICWTRFNVALWRNVRIWAGTFAFGSDVSGRSRWL